MMIPDPMLVSNFQGHFLLPADTFNNGEFYGFQTWMTSYAVLYLISDFTARLQAMLRFFFVLILRLVPVSKDVWCFW